MTTQLQLVNGKITDPDGLDPDADLDYELDLTTWMPAGDNVASVTVDGVNCTPYNATNTTVKVKCWVKLAIATESKAQFTFHVVTAAGRKEDWTVYAKIKQK